MNSFAIELHFRRLNKDESAKMLKEVERFKDEIEKVGRISFEMKTRTPNRIAIATLRLKVSRMPMIFPKCQRFT